MKQKKLDILNKILLIFLAIQPFLDIYMAVVGEKLDIFGISIATLIRTSFVVITFIIIVIYQIKYNLKKKLLYLIIGYLIFVLIYSIAHHLNIMYSDGYYITEGIYNAIKEAMYVERLVVPTLLLYNVIITKPDKKKLKNVLLFVVCVISIVIIITNIFKVSFASYITNENQKINYSFIDWFSRQTIPYKESLSKGWFVSANQIGALLVILLPITIYYMLKENKIYSYIIFFFQIIASTLIGTRVASIGWILVCVAMAIIYVTLLRMKKIRRLTLQNVCAIILIIEVGVLLYVNSPAHNRDFIDTYQSMYEEEISTKEENYITLSDFKDILTNEDSIKEYLGKSVPKHLLEYEAMCKYISENHRYHGITKKYINQIYPYQDDPKFWLEIFSLPAAIKADNRGRQLEIVKRIKAKNNNEILDTLLGIGATPMNDREYMIENDIISHYYNLGIIGITIFVTPFVTCLIYIVIKLRKEFLALFNLQFLALALSLCVAYFLGYFAGHVLDEYIVTLYLAPIAAIIVNLYKEGDLLNESKT